MNLKEKIKMLEKNIRNVKDSNGQDMEEFNIGGEWVRVSFGKYSIDFGPKKGLNLPYEELCPHHVFKDFFSDIVGVDNIHELFDKYMYLNDTSFLYPIIENIKQYNKELRELNFWQYKYWTIKEKLGIEKQRLLSFKTSIPRRIKSSHITMMKLKYQVNKICINVGLNSKLIRDIKSYTEEDYINYLKECKLLKELDACIDTI